MKSKQLGFSLIEVLIALLVVAVGLLGLAKLQAIAFANTGTASGRALAAFQASSLVSAMRANRSYWSNVATPLTIKITGATLTVTSGDGTLATTYNCVYGAASTNAPCTTAQLAAYDLKTWATNLNSLLPNVTGSVNCPTPAVAPTGCWIQISWYERTLAANTQSLSSVSTAMAAPTYTLYFVP